MNNLDKETLHYVWVFIVGLVGGLLGLNNQNPSMNMIKGRNKLISISLATLSSCFICWVVYEFANYFTHDLKISLASGGFCAWQGAEWVRIKADKFLDRRIDNTHSYSYHEINEDRGKNYNENDNSEIK